MSRAATSSRPFEPGTTGWTVHDLDDPEIERQWFQGRYEIVEGVLTKIPPAYFAGGNVLFNVMHRIKEGGKYRRDAFGRRSDEVRPELFSGLVLPLKEIWRE